MIGRFRVILIETYSARLVPPPRLSPSMHARQASLAETGISEDTLPVQIEVRADVRPRRALTPSLESAAHPTTHRRVLLAARDRREARPRFAIIRQMSANFRYLMRPSRRNHAGLWEIKYVEEHPLLALRKLPDWSRTICACVCALHATSW